MSLKEVYLFYPHNRSDDGIIIELKVDDSPETALQQIKDKNYALKFQGKIGEQPKTTGRIILVGIGYSRRGKVHRCRIEVVQKSERYYFEGCNATHETYINKKLIISYKYDTCI
ncbi:MAG: hypothetical protein LUG56_01565 [Lachnospiraceae bacterium]|nr:hypothetical protein [Lachnospiraceae bacterium]